MDNMEQVDRVAIEELCQSMCGVVTGDLSVRLKTESTDLTVQKLTLLTNFMLETAQRGVERSHAYAGALDEVQRIAGLSAWQLLLPHEEVVPIGRMRHLPDVSAASMYGTKWFVDRVAIGYRQAVAELFQGNGGALEWPEENGNSWFRTEVAALRDEEDISGYLVITQDISDRRRANERIRYLADHDALTGLANRRRLNELIEVSLEISRRQGNKFAIHIIDVDRFKSVNDLLGHAVGDRLLIDLANCLKQEARANDLIARIGGDEFVVLQANVDDVGDACALAGRLLGAVRNRLAETESHTLAGSISIGIALAPDHGATAELLLSHADMALYQVKSSGRNDFAVFNADINDTQLNRRRMEADLRGACERGEMAVHYQPLFEISSDRIVGFEALVRWRRSGDEVSPAVFIPIAEETGSIIEIGTFVLREVCREAAGWAKKLRVAVNISAIQIQDGGLPDLVAAAIAESGLEPERLELEVTESLLLSDVHAATNVLARIKALGVKISIDDFGTGYSSLATLRMFPFDKIKLDRSFVSDLGRLGEAEAIVMAVLGLGRALNVSVVAEGVETEEQATILRTAGCSLLQGYLIGRPAPITKFGEVIGDDSGACRLLVSR
ncbi:diguanylate cyclase (GGDEF) domain-containing protein [Acidocella aminolytica 101 = DSM 11237]|uniref:Sensor-containing diguanylate cyclase/phosphodiesterase PAS/PAC n=2 Tax=Acidocella TaxID=50709 RepID=A0A0D6PK77_9PROT|nr:EAL domain-containing protein [Acidocella aminolytica]GAN82077.1 sensor-containing diguanylate cyclase/phosphodiesterase PAS/PAC [Acidocella aminolytica 101 = DSM 11237]GBQ32719.1 diguanylate cyclase/phosphodiesterase [Acidocella aminolytica 101 = DSM 11237]SHF33810.1 diguanylate cyclase (GGDEF) domain-containing protein [Acidocella aminolytica 101 = DSM 11237]